MYLNVSNIQHFSVGDGPGIRTTIFVKGCNLHCPWCHNPENISSNIQILNYEDIGKTEICGQNMTIKEIINDVLADEMFYEESGGGVTISGGEPMLQTEGVAKLAKQLKDKNISVWIDTAGNVPYEYFARLNEFVEGYLYDYKSGDAEKYKKVIGGDLKLISDNLKTLLQEGKVVRVRIPMIPEFNTSKEDVDIICKNLKDMGVTEVDMVPFHRMGVGKYKSLGLQYAYADTAAMDTNTLGTLMELFRQAGFQVHKAG